MDTLTQQIIFWIIKINIFWGDLSGIPAKTATRLHSSKRIIASASFEAETSVRSPKTNIYFHYLKRPVLDQSIQSGACHMSSSFAHLVSILHTASNASSPVIVCIKLKKHTKTKKTKSYTWTVLGTFSSYKQCL